MNYDDKLDIIEKFFEDDNTYSFIEDIVRYNGKIFVSKKELGLIDDKELINKQEIYKIVKDRIMVDLNELCVITDDLLITIDCKLTDLFDYVVDSVLFDND